MASAEPDRPSLDDLRAVWRASADVVRLTPVLSSASTSERVGGSVAFKAECLQRTGSFKLRGALAKLRAADGRERGVVAGSAGNHAQALAYAARHVGAACEVYMPLDAPLSKVAAVRAFGGVVHQVDETVDECIVSAQARAHEAGMAFVHPFDDLDVIAGQAGLGLELLEQVDDLARVIVPVGGGGLISGVALAVKQARPDVEVIGVQAAACAPFVAALAGAPEVAPALPGQTIADGIAVKRPGVLTLELVRDLVDEVVTVDEPSIAEAMVLLLERSKLVVEGAGAAGLAALLTGAATPTPRGTTVAVLCGGNVDVGRLAQLAARHETRSRRRVRLFARVPDRPGALASVLNATATARVNVITVEHVRDGVELDVRETGVVLTVETNGPAHAAQVVEELRATGHDVAMDDWPAPPA